MILQRNSFEKNAIVLVTGYTQVCKVLKLHSTLLNNTFFSKQEYHNSLSIQKKNTTHSTSRLSLYWYHCHLYNTFAEHVFRSICKINVPCFCLGSRKRSCILGNPCLLLHVHTIWHVSIRIYEYIYIKQRLSLR